MLHCGLHAVNALLGSLRRRPYLSSELDSITCRIHRKELEICPDGTDTIPQESGNYPLETLLVALRLQHLNAEFEKPLPESRRHIIISRTIVGYLIGTGDHYVSIVRGLGAERWRLFDNGRVVDTDPRSPFALMARMTVRPRVVLHVTRKR
jgi:hypothetical protein